MISGGPWLRAADNHENTFKCQRADNDIIFTEANLWGVQTPHNDAVVVSMTIVNYDVKRCLINNKNSVDVIFYDCFSRMQWFSTKLLKSINVPLVRFTSDSVKVEGEIELPIMVGQLPRQSTIHLNFFVLEIWMDIHPPSIRK